MNSETLLRTVKDKKFVLPFYVAVATLAVSRAVRRRSNRKQKDNSMGIKFRKINNAEVSPTSGVEDRGLKVSEYNYQELAQYIETTNVKRKPAVAKVYVDGGGDESKHRIEVPTAKGPRIAKVGDVVVRRVVDVVRGEDGQSRYHEYSIIKEADFAGYAK